MGLFKDYIMRDYEIIDTAEDLQVAVNRSILPPSREVTVVGTKEALRLVPVSRCLGVLETAMIQLPLTVKRGIEEIDSPSWLITPDLRNQISQAEWIGQTTLALAVYGNAFWYLERGQRGITNIQVLRNDKVSLVTDNNGNTGYYVDGLRVNSNSIKHIKFWNLPGDELGEGPLQRHKATLKAALDLNNYFANWFDNSAIPTGILNTDSHINQEQATMLLQAFLDSQKTRTPAVMGYGMKYEPLTLNPEEAQFLENQKFIARQVSTMFGVPGNYLGLSNETTGLAYSNTNDDRRKLYEDGLQQYIVRIEQAITDLLPRGQEAKFNLTAFLRPDDKTRYDGYKVALEAGFLTVNEVREFEGLPELTPAEQAELAPEPVDTDAIQLDQGDTNDTAN